MSYGNTGGGYQTGKDECSWLGFLMREDDRRLRAQAWRHVHRINPAATRKVWRAHHPKPERPALEKAQRKWGRVRLFGKGAVRGKWKLYDFTTAAYSAEVVSLGG